MSLSRRWKSGTCSSRSAFTLLEVLVAVAIMSVVTSTLLVIRNNAISQSGEAYNLRVATILAARKLREIELSPNPSGAVGGGDFRELPGYSWDARASDLSLGKEIQLAEDVTIKQIKLTVTYPASGGAKKSVEWVTLIPPPVELSIEDLAEDDVPSELMEELQKAGIPFPGRRSGPE